MSLRRARVLVACCCLLTLVAWPTPAPAVRAAIAAYAVAPLATPTLVYDPSVMALNEAGQVVGHGYYHAFLSDHGVVTDLGTLGGPYSWVGDIDEQGSVVGYADRAGEEGASRAFLYRDGAMVELAGLSATGGARAFGINGRGQIVGWANPNNSSQLHAVVWTDGVIADLGTPEALEPYSLAASINDHGQIAGAAKFGIAVHAVIWEGGTLRDLGPGYGNDINAAGQVLIGADQAYLWSDGVRTPIGTLGGRSSYAADLNDLGQVVGTSQTGYGPQRAFLWQAGGLYDLNELIPADSGWYLERATAINNGGTIVGVGVKDGQGQAFQLTPTGPLPPPHPPSPPPSPSPSPSPSGEPRGTHTATASVAGRGTVTPSGATTYAAGEVATFAAHPDDGQLFTGWVVDGRAAGWANPLPLTMDGDRTLVAKFAPRPQFADATPSDTGATEAIAQLAGRGIVKGCDQAATPPLFCPTAPTLRAQMAALIVRAMGWDDENPANPFPDRNGVDDELWGAIAILADHGVAKGYGDGTYGTTSPVLNAQVISFITRAMVDAGYWTFQPDDGSVYPNVAASSGHRVDLATYVHYAGLVRGTASAGGNFDGWDQPSSRAYFAFALWQALDSHFGAVTAP